MFDARVHFTDAVSFVCRKQLLARKLPHIYKTCLCSRPWEASLILNVSVTNFVLLIELTMS